MVHCMETLGPQKRSAKQHFDKSGIKMRQAIIYQETVLQFSLAKANLNVISVPMAVLRLTLSNQQPAIDVFS